MRTLGNTQEIISATDLSATRKVASINSSNEIVFCSADFSFAEIIQQIDSWGNKIDYKILNECSNALIGSNSKNSAGDLYVAERSYALFKPQNIRGKRVFDFVVALLLLTLLPVNVFVIKNFGKFISNWISVLSGTKSWIGFSSEKNLKAFANAKPGILHPAEDLKDLDLNEEDIVAAEQNYARHYSVSNDMQLLFKNYSSLGK